MDKQVVYLYWGVCRFSCLGTTDRDVLVKELHTLIGSQLSREGCEFFLEVGNWCVMYRPAEE